MITKKELVSYLKKSFLPRLGENWQLNSNDTILRKTGMVIQGVYFNRSSYGKCFVPQFFIQVLAIPQNFISLQLGSRLKDHRGADLWLDWVPEDNTLVEKVWMAYQKQANPPLDLPLTLDTAVCYIEAVCRKSKHFYDHWSLGILYGYQGCLVGCKKHLEDAKQNLQEGVNDWLKKGKEPPSWMIENIESISIFLAHLTSTEEFRAYCDEQAAVTATALKIK